MMTTTFSEFSLYLDLPPVHPTPTAPNLISLFNVHKHVVQVPSHTLHHFVPAPPLTSSLDSRTGPQFGRFQEEIAFLWGDRKLHLQSPTSWTSDDEFALAFCGSIFDPRRVAIKLIILKCNGFSLTSPVNDRSPPSLSHPNSLLCHSPLRSAKPSAKRRSTCQSYPAPPIPRLTLFSSTSSSVTTSSSSHAISSPSSSPSPLPPTPTPMSHVRRHVCRPHPRSCVAADCVRDDQFSVFPLSLYEEDFNVYLQGVDWQTDTTIREEREQRGVAMLRVFLGLGTVRSRTKTI